MNHWNTFLLVLVFGGASKTVQGEKTVQLFPGFDLKYTVNQGMIDFIAVVRTDGWFGIGINENPEMMGADMAIAVLQDGKPQISDYHGGSHIIEKDIHQDWNLVERDSSSNATHMHVHFQRKLVTGDPNKDQDKDIKNTPEYIIWAFGKDKAPTYHGPNRGFTRVNLLDGEPTGSTTSQPGEPTTRSIPPSTTPKDTSGGTVLHNWNNFITVSLLLAATLLHSNSLTLV